MDEELHPDEAARALTEIDRRQEQVINLAIIPGWYWWTTAGLMVGLSAAVDSHLRLTIGISVSVFVVGILTTTGWVVLGSLRHAQVRNDLLGPVGVLAILGFVAAVLAVSLPTAFAMRATGMRYPATAGVLAGAIVMVIGGPLLMRFLRHTMLANRAGSRR